MRAKYKQLPSWPSFREFHFRIPELFRSARSRPAARKREEKAGCEKVHPRLSAKWFQFDPAIAWNCEKRQAAQIQCLVSECVSIGPLNSRLLRQVVVNRVCTRLDDPMPLDPIRDSSCLTKATSRLRHPGKWQSEEQQSSVHCYCALCNWREHTTIDAQATSY